MVFVFFALCAGWVARSLSGDRPAYLGDFVAWVGMLTGGVMAGLQLGL